MENTRFKISQYACAVLLIVSSIALVAYQVVSIEDVAAGLLYYAPEEAEVYLIDPKPVDTHTMRDIHVIQAGASAGVKYLTSLLEP
jgi:hypothetical protein